MKRKYIILLSLMIVGAIAVYMYLFQDHRDIQDEPAKKEITAEMLLDAFNETPDIANNELLNATLKVTGTVTQVDNSTIVLDNSAFFSLLQPQNIEVGKTATIKARCIGFDDLLGEVKLDQAKILNN